MKILLANPAFRRPLHNGMERYLLGAGMRFPWSLLKHKNDKPRYAMFPFFMAYSAAILEKNNFTVDVIDGVPLNLSGANFMQHVIQSNPAVIIFEPNTAVIDNIIALTKLVKQQTNALIIYTGTHATYFAQELLHHYHFINYVVLGEYEMTLLQLMRAIRNNSPIDNIPGIAYRKDNDILIRDRAEPIHLEDLPPPARHLFPSYFNNDLSLYHDGFCQKFPSFHMHSSRGCPYRCNFCAWVQLLYDNGQQRLFSPQRIVDEMKFLKEQYGAQEIYFDDDNFTANLIHVEALCDEIIKRKLDISWSAMTDAITLTEILLEKMADAGCIGIKFGLDSADVRILSNIKKPLKLRKLESIVKKARQLGIKTHMSVVFGLSGENKETLRKTFQYSCNLDIDSVQYSLATPCPGTTMYEDLLKEGRISVKNWSEYDGANSSVIKYDHFSRKHIESFMSKAHSDWLRRKIVNPLWLFRQVRYLSRTAKSQGLPGITRRFKRATLLIFGDATTILENNSAKTIRR